MGKHETGYARVERDFYRTPPWVIEALAKHVDFTGRKIWEPAAGDGQMVEALKAAGAAGVYCSDIANHGYPLDEIFDFASTQCGKLAEKLKDDCDIVTNPPFGPRGKLAEAFVEAGLQRLPRRGILALLLPFDFSAAKTRARFFRDCPYFVAKIELTHRVAWFQPNDGKRASPKENHAWYLWSKEALRAHRQPVVLYAPEAEPLQKTPGAEALRQPEQLRRAS